MQPSIQEFCQEKLRTIEEQGLLRKLRNVHLQDGRHMMLEGRKLLNFSANDYLGLASHPALKQCFEGEMLSGATASRLISGNHQAYRDLENALISFKRTESALVFSSGYAAALGTIPALVGEGDFIVMDKLAHASLVDGARLSGATIRVFPHNNMKRCGELLKNCREKAGAESKILLVTESLFSMDGDLAPLDVLVELKEKYGAWLLVDEAHATGVLGANGRGGAELFGVDGKIEVSMGTLSKALAAIGGFICGSKSLTDYLVNSSRSLIFSTGLPPVVCKIATKALQIVKDEPQRRIQLRGNITTLRHLLDDMGGMIPEKFESPIIPMILGDERRCVEISQHLLEQGFFVPAVRFPTVKKGSARLRLSLSASHVQKDLEDLSKTLTQSFKVQVS